MISAVSRESTVIRIYHWRHSIVSRITVISYGSGGTCHRSAKIPDLISLHLQATVSKWRNGRIIVSGNRNNITVRAEATEGAEYLALLLSGENKVEFNKADFAEHNGWFSAEKNIPAFSGTM
ncbi:hypothetical protein WKC53_17645 [Morganella morganii]|uniref:hypothetical protein n=1 Tax=Morganella morganii TaxID=582 RepID=UPI0030FE7213